MQFKFDANKESVPFGQGDSESTSENTLRNAVNG